MWLIIAFARKLRWRILSVLIGAFLLLRPVTTPAGVSVTIQPGPYRDEASGAQASGSFRVIAEPFAGRVQKAAVYDYWEAEFPSLAITDVKTLGWEVVSYGAKHRFLLWPLSVDQPKRDADATFELRPWEAVNGEISKQARDYVHHGNFSMADKTYKEFAPVFSRFPEGWQVTGLTVAAFHHTFLTELTAAAAAFRTTRQWLQKKPADRVACNAIERAWRLQLIINNERKTDDDSLKWLAESALSWWVYASAQDIRRKPGWTRQKYYNNAVFFTPKNASTFRKDFDLLMDCLRDPEVQRAIDAKIARVVPNDSMREQQLLLWAKWKGGAEDKNITLGQIEYILNGLYYVFVNQPSP